MIRTKNPVLFVDDEENILSSLRRLFADEEFDIITANSGEEGLGVLKGNPDISLIVSDQRMPGMGGVEFLEKARKLTPLAPRIILTGYADMTVALDAINKGEAYRYITKPWQDDELVEIVKDAVHKYQLIKENKRLTGVVTQQNKKLKQWNSRLEKHVQQQTTEIRTKSLELEELYKKLRKDFESLIAAFSGLIELRDQGSGKHLKNVAEISAAMIKKMKLPPKETESIIVAALLHDLGKIGIHDVLFIKDFNDMNSEERNKYMLHPLKGAMALESVESLKTAAKLIKHHHEEYNGTGFPDNLTGDKIPLGSRIIAMADFFDRTIRKNRGGDVIKLALKKVKKEVGRKFDPELYPPFKDAVTDIYKRILARIALDDEIELELFPKDLQAGMVVTRNIETDILLLTSETVLTNHTIQILKQYYNINSAKSGIFVRVKK